MKRLARVTVVAVALSTLGLSACATITPKVSPEVLESQASASYSSSLEAERERSAVVDDLNLTGPDLVAKARLEAALGATLPPGFFEEWKRAAAEMCSALEVLPPELVGKAIDQAANGLSGRAAIVAQESARIAVDLYCPEVLR